MHGLQAGVARTTINPPLGSYLIGYADRDSGCESIRDDLTATALVLRHGELVLALVALDMLCLNERVVARIRGAIEARADIRADHVMISCSHTHCGPIAFADAQSSAEHRAIVNALVERVADVTCEAAASRTPVSVARGSGEIGIAVNRRERTPDGRITLGVDPAGFVDRALQVWQLRTDPGRVIATLVNATCHPAVLGPRHLCVSAEWPGVMRSRVEAATDGASCLFLQGATGNQNPRHEWGDDDLDAMERLGAEVGDEVLRVCASGLDPLPATPLRAASERLWLPIVQATDARGRELSYRDIAGQLLGVPGHVVDGLLEARYPWKTTVRKGSDGRREMALEIQAFRLGEGAVLSHAAETFSEIGAAIKARSPRRPTLFAGYSNGCIGYLPTAEAHAGGGYEVEQAPLAYRMSGVFDPGCAEAVIERSLALLARL